MKKNVSIAKGVTIENAIGGSGNDVIVGNSADNFIDGGAGNDIIYGGAGQDLLKGGAGSDVFVYKDISDSTSEAPDMILDFETGIDKINFESFNKSSGFIHFSDKFTGAAGEVVVSYDKASNVSEVVLSIDNSTTPDMKIEITGYVNIATDFIV